ncbi:MAG: hypothetical protein M1820_006785 [Bogoriella megaspora]|nr:MAG: hypothetical protein M1820_006785 [Bogoriella megaspora]
MACVARTNIPKSVLYSSKAHKAEQLKAIGTLKAYAFLAEREAPERQQEVFFDVHRLVHLTTQKWLKSRHEWSTWVGKALERLEEILHFDSHTSLRARAAYTHHAYHLASLPEIADSKAESRFLMRVVSYWDLHGRHDRLLEELPAFILGKAQKKGSSGATGLEWVVDGYTALKEQSHLFQEQSDWGRALRMFRKSGRAKKIKQDVDNLLENMARCRNGFNVFGEIGGLRSSLGSIRDPPSLHSQPAQDPALTNGSEE